MFPCSSIQKVLASKSPLTKKGKNLRPWLTRLLVTAATTSLAFFPTAAQAQRTFTTRNAFQLRGRTTIFGNPVTTCSTTVGPNSGNCTTAQQTTSTPGNNGLLTNNAYWMDYVDIDSDIDTFNSSSATYNFPTGNPGFQIVWAGLYWAGDTSQGGTFNGNPVGVEAPTPSNRGQMLLKIPGSSIYQTINATTLDVISSTRYSAFADVTSLVQSGGSGTYTGANIQTGKGEDRYGGWALIVVYADDTEILRSMTIFDGFQGVGSSSPLTTTISGFLTPNAGPFESSIGAFISEGDVGFFGDQFLIDGDGNNSDGDATDQPFVNVSDSENPASNFFNSSSSLFETRIGTSTNVNTPDGKMLGPIGRNPAFPNLLAMDIDIVEAEDNSGTAIMQNNATEAGLQFTSQGDVYYPTAFFFSVEVFQPVLTQNFTKTVTDVNGGDLNPGDILEYTITYQNTGNDNATDVVLTDAIPANTTYEAGSLRILTDPDPGITTPLTQTDTLNDDRAEFDSTNNRVVFRSGIGADNTNGGNVPFDDPNVAGAVDDTVSVSFRVRVDSGITTFPTTISNQAVIDYVGEFSGTPFTGNSDDPTTPSEPDDPTDIDVVEPTDPNLILIKRITRINGVTTNGAVDLDVYIDDVNSPYDDNVDEVPPFAAQPDPNQDDTTNWPDADSLNGPDDYLKGVIDAGEVQPGDEIEYTIYFLSTGGVPARTVQLCDRVPAFQTFVLDAYNAEAPAPSGGVGASRGILVDYNNSVLAYTNDGDGDTAQFYPPGSTLPAACNGSPAQSEDNGAIVVDLGDLPQATGPGNPATSYGAVRFRATVK
ncbi:conserved domain protein [Acaryochloris marina MBIC11017]|uniref:Conserved domain protein n=1 Tax=Acaryochloris marina (strain MBIC 11017) TaxID=329726 RepID=B0C9N1_ACAM1|nr:conserved domain protein [Acaryochloris marina MBIC11017]